MHNESTGARPYALVTMLKQTCEPQLRNIDAFKQQHFN
eukprot:COSAG02_NODE_25711_length_651_cov_1.012681_1_plen_37_part_01